MFVAVVVIISQVLWTAPRGEIECVTLKAAVIPDKQQQHSNVGVSHHNRAKQYGMVRKKMCRQPGIDITDYDEEDANNAAEEDKNAETNRKPPILATCCACGEAKYEVCSHSRTKLY